MKIDEDDLFMAVLLVGLVVCSPFIALYYAGKWIYGKTPKAVKERKAKEEMNREIHELEKQLGLTDRDDTCTNCDPLYVGKTHRGREGYLADLKKKTAWGIKVLTGY